VSWAEIVRLQGVLIEDTRFTCAGLRPDGVFLGQRNHYGEPVPDFIGVSTADRNVEVLHDTADFYRFFNCTDAAEFLCASVARTVEYDLPSKA
jgi:hypothetical protein